MMHSLYIPEGEFMMGSNESMTRMRRPSSLFEWLLIKQTEVTNGEFARCSCRKCRISAIHNAELATRWRMSHGSRLRTMLPLLVASTLEAEWEKAAWASAPVIPGAMLFQTAIWQLQHLDNTTGWLFQQVPAPWRARHGGKCEEWVADWYDKE
jgi:hypothetical protein